MIARQFPENTTRKRQFTEIVIKIPRNTIPLKPNLMAARAKVSRTVNLRRYDAENVYEIFYILTHGIAVAALV